MFVTMGVAMLQMPRPHRDASQSGRFPRLAALLVLLGLLGTAPSIALAQGCIAEREPNDDPATGATLVGLGCLVGDVIEADQDFFVWNVTERQLDGRFVIIELETDSGVPVAVTLLRPEAGRDGLQELFDLSSAERSVSGPLVLGPGTYFIGVAAGRGKAGYAVTVRVGERLPQNAEREPNDSSEQAQVFEGAFSLVGDLAASADFYRWSVTQLTAAQAWRVGAQGIPGEPLTVELFDPAGNAVFTASTEDGGALELAGLELAAGTYTFALGPASERQVPYLLEALPLGARTDGVEVEPNDRLSEANRLEPAVEVAGTLVGNDIDYYRFRLSGHATGFFTVGFDADAPAQVCLLDATQRAMHCGVGAGVELTDLALAPGDYGVYLDRGGGEVDYTLSLTPQDSPAPGFETEPNDVHKYAPALEDPFVVRGRFNGRDTDTYRFEVRGAPELWRIQVVGEGVTSLSYLSSTGAILQTQSVSGVSRARLDNLLLLPGVHYLQLAGEDGEYVLRAVPLGPPEPTAEAPPAPTADNPAFIPGPRPEGEVEIEPNDQATRANPLRFGEPRIGLLTLLRDVDNFRFSLDSEEYVRVEATPPHDGRVSFSLGRSGNNRSAGVGEAVVYDVLLLPGDHFLNLRPEGAAFEGYYQLRLTRLDPLSLPTDLEPNDSQAQARPLPPALSFAGRAGQRNDADWFTLPQFAAETAVLIESEGDINDIILYTSDGSNARLLTHDRTAGTFTGVIPSATALAMRLRGSGDYRLTFHTGPAPDQVSPTVAEAPPALTLTLDTAAPGFASFWHQGQQIELTATIGNTGASDETVRIEAASSDHRVIPILPDGELTLAAGATATVPVRLLARPDLHDNQPITLTVGAGNDLGLATSTIELNSICELPPADPRQLWHAPEPLLGGLNVAWEALGAGVLDLQGRDADIIDGRVAPVTGAIRRPGDIVDIDLAGDDPVTLVGAVLHPLGRTTPQEQLQDFRISISLDGASFEPILEDRLSAVQTDQAFAFAAPVEARFARLEFLSNHSGLTSAGLGEIKLLSAPHDNPLGRPNNIADARLGGHVVWADPRIGGVGGPNPMLVEDTDVGVLVVSNEGVDGTAAMTWVLGFHHNRAARIREIQWLDSIRQQGYQNFETIEVSVSLDSPIGPWQRLATWQVNRSSGAVVPLALEAPIWARYVRFDATGLPPDTTHVYPQLIRILEQDPGDGYRSILGEWGIGSRDAVFEWLNPPAVSTVAAEDDRNDTRASAQALLPGSPAAGRVLVEADVDWYRIEIPAGQNRLRLELRGDPVINTIFDLQDEAGQSLVFELTTDTLELQALTASVLPGVYYLKIEEPPRSVIFSWDTSGSTAGFYQVTDQTMTRFARDIRAGREEVNLLPFGDPPHFLLNRWSGDAARVMSAVVNFDRQPSSSNALLALHSSTRGLADRDGTRAILLVTDAETGGFDLIPELWGLFEQVRPRIFTFEISTAGSANSQDLMQDWADVNSGVYQFASTIGDLEVGFNRATCILRRPKGYRIDAATETVEAATGSLRVVAEDASGEPSAVSPTGAVEVILDASGSMFNTLEGRFRYEIAKDVLDDLVANTLPDGVPFALRVFGNREASSCRTDLEVPLAPLDRAATRSVIAAIEPQPFAFTPIADSLLQVANDIGSAAGPKTVILITDGEESCDGDVEAAIRSLEEQGIDVELNVIGFDFDADDRDAARARFQAWAELGGGSYFDANSAAELELSLEQAIATPPPFEVLDLSGTVVTTGIVGGDPVELPAGVYSVRILADPVQVVTDVRIEGGQELALSLPAP